MSQTVPLNLSVLFAEGSPASDSTATYSFSTQNGNQAYLPVVEPLKGFRRFDLQPTAANTTVSCTVSCPHFRDVTTGFFFVTPGNPVAKQVIAFRDPTMWTPVFRKLAALTGPAFKPLRDVIARSSAVDLKDGTQLGPLKTAFDNLTGVPQEFAKMALLNLYAMTSGQRNPMQPFTDRSWFSFVQKVVRVDRERFVAEVDKAMFDSVQHILTRQDYFRGLGFFPEPSPRMHVGNFPAQYQITAKSPIATVKKQCEEGNLQLTLAESNVGGGSPVYLLDCDMDEHASGILHFFDAFLVHAFTGGTNPIDMHEVIMLADSATQFTNVAGIDLGYDLTPI